MSNKSSKSSSNARSRRTSSGSGYFPQVGDTAPDVTLQNERGEAARLSSYWQSMPTVLLFVRHFG
jgi:hypothetical protein